MKNATAIFTALILLLLFVIQANASGCTQLDMKGDWTIYYSNASTRCKFTILANGSLKTGTMCYAGNDQGSIASGYIKVGSKCNLTGKFIIDYKKYSDNIVIIRYGNLSINKDVGVASCLESSSSSSSSIYRFINIIKEP
jgi:hypothetical protein